MGEIKKSDMTMMLSVKCQCKSIKSNESIPYDANEEVGLFINLLDKGLGWYKDENNKITCPKCSEFEEKEKEWIYNNTLAQIAKENPGMIGRDIISLTKKAITKVEE